jgi:hypothetical protein
LAQEFKAEGEEFVVAFAAAIGRAGAIGTQGERGVAEGALLEFGAGRKESGIAVVTFGFYAFAAGEEFTEERAAFVTVLDERAGRAEAESTLVLGAERGGTSAVRVERRERSAALGAELRRRGGSRGQRSE